MSHRTACAAFVALPVALALIVPTRADPPQHFTEAEIEAASLRYEGNIPIVTLSGSPEEIGRQHAALLATPARATLKFPRRYLGEFGADFAWPLMVAAGHVLMKNAPTAHQRELAAIGAAGLDADELAVGNTLLELRRMGCSVLVVEPEHSAAGGPLFGRNFDFPTLGELDQYSVLFIVKPRNGRAFASITFPGAVGVISGMNDAGLAVATLDVYRSADGSSRFNPAGTPLALVFRRILEECATVDEAEALLRAERATTWMNLAVCDRDRAAVFEITPASIGRRDAEQGVLPCTNHFRTAGLADENRCWRYPRLAAAAAGPPLDVEQVRDYLHAANQGELTLQTMVFEPRELVLHLAIGAPPTSDDELTRIELAPLFAAEPVAVAP